MRSSSSRVGDRVDRGVAEDRGVVDPAGERRRGLRGVGRALGDRLVARVAHHGDRARRTPSSHSQRGRVELDRHDRVAVGQQPLDDRAADPAARRR